MSAQLRDGIAVQRPLLLLLEPQLPLEASSGTLSYMAGSSPSATHQTRAGPALDGRNELGAQRSELLPLNDQEMLACDGHEWALLSRDSCPAW